MDRNEQLKLIDILMKNIKLEKNENKTKIDFNLLYRMSKHGRKTSIFHKCCNSKERIIIIIHTEYGNICGGFSNVSLSENYAIDKCHTFDDESFLFLIRCGFDNQCNVWKTQAPMFSLYTYCKNGPV